MAVLIAHESILDAVHDLIEFVDMHCSPFNTLMSQFYFLASSFSKRETRNRIITVTQIAQNAPKTATQNMKFSGPIKLTYQHVGESSYC